MNLSINKHLSKEEIIKNGSIFTPEYIVDLVYSMISGKIDNNSVVIDFGAGYGAFISRFEQLKAKKFIATDCDELSIEFLKKYDSCVNTICENSLKNIVRSKYASNAEDIIVVGNPPYNDVTSQYKKGEKGSFEIDDDVFARDVGISFLKMYSKIDAKYICVLHPLSYLCKKNNFSSLGEFSKRYKLINGILFSSKHFESINKINAEFPVVAALYERNNDGMSFNDVLNFKFSIFQTEKTFVLSSYKTIDGIVDKYPTKNKEDSDLQFYTIRDINALKRNKSFLTGHCNNGILVNKDNLKYYAWLDFFKCHFFAGDFEYLFGNLSPLTTDKIRDKKFVDALLGYIMNENKIVARFYKENDPSFYEKYSSLSYDESLLLCECSRLSKVD